MNYQSVKSVESVDEFFLCSCSVEAHTVRFSYHPWDPDKELYHATF